MELPYVYYLVYFCAILIWLSSLILFLFYKNITIYPISGRLPYNTIAIHINWCFVIFNEFFNSLYVPYYYGIIDLFTLIPYYNVLYFYIFRLFYLLFTSKKQDNALSQNDKESDILKWKIINNKTWTFWTQTSKYILFSIDFIYSIVCFICLGLDPSLFTTVYTEGLHTSIPYTFCLYLGLAILFIGIIIMIILVINIHSIYEDAFWMKTEVTMTTYFTTVCWFSYVILTIIFSQSRWIASLPIFFLGFFMIVTGTIWPYVLSRKEKEKLFNEITNKIDLLDILSTKDGHQAFLNYLRAEFSSENLLFWQQVEAFKIQNGDLNSLRQTIHAIYSQFISDRAPYQINISSEIKEIITENFLKINQVNDCNELLQIFDIAQHCIYDLMKNDTYIRFQRNSTYFKNMSESRKSKSLVSPSVALDVIEEDSSLLV